MCRGCIPPARWSWLNLPTSRPRLRSLRRRGIFWGPKSGTRFPLPMNTTMTDISQPNDCRLYLRPPGSAGMSKLTDRLRRALTRVQVEMLQYAEIDPDEIDAEVARGERT